MLAMAAAARNRFTPVLLTSLTTIAGAVPMAFSHGRLNSSPISGLGRAAGARPDLRADLHPRHRADRLPLAGAARAGFLRLARSL
jgi:hypothetical protein